LRRIARDFQRRR